MTRYVGVVAFGIVLLGRPFPQDRSVERLNEVKRFLQLEMLDDAQQALEAIVRTNRFDKDAHFLLGEVSFARKNWERARAEYRIALNLGNQAVYHARLAVVNAHLLASSDDPARRLEVLTHSRAYLGAERDPSLTPDQARVLETSVNQAVAIARSVTGRWLTSGGGQLTLSEELQSGKVAVNTGSVPGNLLSELQRQAGSDLFLGTLVLGPANSLCAVDIELRLSDDALSLNGTARVSKKIKSTKACLNMLAADARKGREFPYSLLRSN